MKLGIVATPFDLLNPKERPLHEQYLIECAQTMSVSVILDTGEFLANCRVLTSPPAKRQLPAIPKLVNGKIIPGDTVLVDYISGSKNMPVVVGVLSPILPPKTPPSARPKTRTRPKR